MLSRSFQTGGPGPLTASTATSGGLAAFSWHCRREDRRGGQGGGVQNDDD